MEGNAEEKSSNEDDYYKELRASIHSISQERHKVIFLKKENPKNNTNYQ